MATEYTVNVDYPPRVIRITPDIYGFSGTLTSVKVAPLAKGKLSAPLDLVFYDGPPAFVSNGYGKGAVYATQNEIAVARTNLPMIEGVGGNSANDDQSAGFTFSAAFTNGLYVVAYSYSSFVVTIDEAS